MPPAHESDREQEKASVWFCYKIGALEEDMVQLKGK